MTGPAAGFGATAWSLLPPALAIGLAIATKRVYLSLFAGVAAGVLLATGLDAPAAVTRLATRDLWLAFWNPAEGTWSLDRLTLLGFTLVIGATVQLMQASGGTAGLVAVLVRFATTRTRAQVMAGLAGLLIFFDDYANCLIIGPAFGAVFAYHRLSKAKLAWIVDTTASADASLWFVSTWIGYEVGLIADALKPLSDPTLATLSPYGVFLDSIPSRYYLLFTLALVFIVAWTGREIGPMRHAEAAARKAKPEHDGSRIRPGHWSLAAIPMLVLLVGTLVALVLDGRASLAKQGTSAGASFRDVIGAANSYRAMGRASLAALATGMLLSGLFSRLKSKELLTASLRGAWRMVPPLLILALAWALGDLCKELGTGTYVGGRLAGHARPWLLPTLVFAAGAGISFATGTSFGTMAILMPVSVPLAAASASAAGLDAGAAVQLLTATVGSVLAGAVFGDHCSIVSDTTILSATATRCGLYEHYATQMPYALLAGLTAIVCGTLPAGLGLSPRLCLPIGLIAMWSAIRLLGRKV